MWFSPSAYSTREREIPLYKKKIKKLQCEMKNPPQTSNSTINYSHNILHSPPHFYFSRTSTLLSSHIMNGVRPAIPKGTASLHTPSTHALSL